jgi:hypothetical protein
MAEAARLWAAAGRGPVIGITPSQSARNTLAARVPESYNTAQFLGHVPGQRGARGPMDITEGTLLLVDESSMIPTPDLSDLVSLAEARSAKMVLAGDTEQLQAVENGGAMSLLADTLGHVRLPAPVRFRAAWEQAASLRLRAGDTSVLADYDQHGRIIAGEPEQMTDAAGAVYVALTLDGTDTLLMAAEHGLRRELSRRIRDDLIHLGVVQADAAVRIADGAEASVGDLIVCTKNDHSVQAGEPGRSLANGDLLRIEAITPAGLLVRRALDADPRTGQRRWTDRNFLYANHRDAELGYAVTDHVAQSRTVHTGLAVITGTEDRQHAYVALTRGTDTNTAYVFTLSPKTADPAPGPRPAPELARYDRFTAEHNGEPPNADQTTRTSDALGVLSEVLQRDGQQLSALQTQQQALSDADHLAILHAIWTAETTPAREQNYRKLLMDALPPQYRQEPGHRARWLWRTIRAAELAGLDPAQALAAAIGERDLTGARDLPSVIDARLRHRVSPLVPLPPGSWCGQMPDIADPERKAFVAQIAGMMDARKIRIGEHAADNALPWAINALGPVPDHPLDRLEWQRRASSIGAYRELSGHDHPAEPIGPEPTAGDPDKRAAWHEACAVLGPVDGPDVRGLPDGTLMHLRDTYPIETTWAPQWVADELRQVRLGASEASLAAIRADAEAKAAADRGDNETAARQQTLAASYRAMHDAYRDRETVFVTTMADRTDWDQATRQQRHLAVAADAELRRRHPDQRFPPLRSAEPQPDQLTMTTGEETKETGQWIKDLAAEHHKFADKLAERQSITIPSEDPDYGDLGQAFPPWKGRAKDAILQPPKPEIRPSARVLERAADRDLDAEAAN